MKILIDVSALSSSYAVGGVGRYLRTLLVGLSDLQNHELQIGVIASPTVLSEEYELLHDFRHHKSSLPEAWSFSAALSSQLCPPVLRKQYDLVHSPCISYNPRIPTVSLFPAMKQVSVVHDLIPLKMKDHYLTRWYQRALYDLSLRRVGHCAVVIAVSDHTAADVDTRRLASRVAVVPNCLSSGASDTSESTVDEDLVLAFSPHGPSKNPELLADIAALYYARTSKRITFIGAATAPPDGVSVGTVDDKTLRELYRRARAIVIPSLHEGFCYPAVEAAIEGTSVLAFDATWSRWIFSSRDNLCGPSAVEWVDKLTADRLPSSIVKESLISRTPRQMAAETVSVWRQVLDVA